MSDPFLEVADAPVAIPKAIETCPRIDPADVEFSRIQYLLRLSLRSASAKVLALHSVSSPHLNLQFDKVSKGALVLDSWIDTTMLDDNNSLDKILDRGFALPETAGSIFPTGEIGGLGEDVRRYEFLVCRLAVGRSYLMESSQISAQTEVPQGFQSIYVHYGSKDMERDSQDGTSSTINNTPAVAIPDVPSFAPRDAEALSFHHSYLLKNPAQILPCFHVIFAYDPTADARAKSSDVLARARAAYEHLKRTDSLEDAIALRQLLQRLEKKPVLEDSDVAALTKATGKFGGAAGAASTNLPLEITKEDIESGVFGFCASHPRQPLEFWDSVWNIPVCVYCKMLGSHSQGDAATHPLVPVAESYSQALSAARRDDRLLETRRAAIIHHLRVVDDRLEKINRNAAEVEERIYAILQACMSRLQELTQHKLSVLLGEEAELRRQLEHLDWIEGFLNYQRGILGARAFLDAWKNHQTLRTTLHQKPLLRAQLDVYPDLKCEGEVRVVTDQILKEVAMIAAEQGGKEVKREIMNNASTSYRQTLFSNFTSPALRRQAFFGGAAGGDNVVGVQDTNAAYYPPPPHLQQQQQQQPPFTPASNNAVAYYSSAAVGGGGQSGTSYPPGVAGGGGGAPEPMAARSEDLWRESIEQTPVARR